MAKIERPRILDQTADSMWPIEQREKFELLKRTALIDYDRALLAPGQPVGQDQVKDLASAIGRANKAIAERGEY